METSGDGSEAEVFDGLRNELYYNGLIDNMSLWDNESALSDVELASIASSFSNVASVPVKSPLAFLFALLLLVAWLRIRKAKIAAV